jgi:hypothetical protein
MNMQNYAILGYHSKKLSSVNTREIVSPLCIEGVSMVGHERAKSFKEQFIFCKCDNIWLWVRQAWLAFIMECELVYKHM